MKNNINISILLFSSLFFSSCMMLMHSAMSRSEGELKDPVCGMSVEETSKYNFEYESKNYYFCSEDCLNKFKADPLKFKNSSTSEHKGHSTEMGSMMSTWHLALMAVMMIVVMIFKFN